MLNKSLKKYIPLPLRKFLLENYYRNVYNYQIFQFNRYRRTYHKLKFKQKKKLASKWLVQYPEQAHFNYAPVDHWLKNIVPEHADIIEIGGWRGDLAQKALSEFDNIRSWHNYDLLKFNGYQKCNDKRYKLITLDDYLWHTSLDYEYNALIATHMIEHISWRELTWLIKWIPQGIKTVLFEAPLPASCEKISWKGDHSSHVLEKGWEQVINEMKKNNFSIDFSEDNTCIFVK